ncbi:helix-turn-helix transcriptional regulator [Kitasatospora sp. NPDC096128]|uniref:helix-turn-helix domain-containing protein n=1 Tax=Kitasatospora sp. NPDC096128 TaxID=3155547 RepID=UPI003324A762
MPGRQNPTFRQRRLGAELRRMREQAGLSGNQLARMLGVSAPQVTQMENGKTSASADRIRTIAEACKCENLPLINALGGLVTSRRKSWWDQYRDCLSDGLLKTAEHEDFAAGVIRSWTSAIIPGPLQTEDYARGVFSRRIPPLSTEELNLRIEFRSERRRKILQHPSKSHEAYIHESSLVTRFGGTEVLRNQLHSLIDDSLREDVIIRVVPFTAHTYPGPIENLVYSFGEVPELDTIEVELSRSPIYLDDPTELASYRKVFDRIARTALSEEDSQDLIRQTLKNLKG